MSKQLQTNTQKEPDKNHINKKDYTKLVKFKKRNLMIAASLKAANLWTSLQVREWLEELFGDDVIQKIKMNAITGETLTELLHLKNKTRASNYIKTELESIGLDTLAKRMKFWYHMRVKRITGYNILKTSKNLLKRKRNVKSSKLSKIQTLKDNNKCYKCNCLKNISDRTDVECPVHPVYDLTSNYTDLRTNYDQTWDTVAQNVCQNTPSLSYANSVPFSQNQFNGYINEYDQSEMPSIGYIAPNQQYSLDYNQQWVNDSGNYNQVDYINNYNGEVNERDGSFYMNHKDTFLKPLQNEHNSFSNQNYKMNTNVNQQNNFIPPENEGMSNSVIGNYSVLNCPCVQSDSRHF